MKTNLMMNGKIKCVFKMHKLDLINYWKKKRYSKQNGFHEKGKVLSPCSPSPLTAGIPKGGLHRHSSWLVCHW